MIPPRRPYVMTSPSGCSTKSAAGNNSAPVVPPPTLLKLSPNSIDLGYHTMVRISKVSMLKIPHWLTGFAIYCSLKKLCNRNCPIKNLITEMGVVHTMGQHHRLVLIFFQRIGNTRIHILNFFISLLQKNRIDLKSNR